MSNLEEAILTGADFRVLAANVLRGCPTLHTVRLPNGLREIGHTALFGCTSLREFTFPSSLAEIGDSAFMRSGLTSVRTAASVIGDRAFAFMPNLVEVELTGPIVQLQWSVFTQSPLMTRLVVPETFRGPEQPHPIRVHCSDVLFGELRQLDRPWLNTAVVIMTVPFVDLNDASVVRATGLLEDGDANHRWTCLVGWHHTRTLKTQYPTGVSRVIAVPPLADAIVLVDYSGATYDLPQWGADLDLTLAQMLQQKFPLLFDGGRVEMYRIVDSIHPERDDDDISGMTLREVALDIARGRCEVDTVAVVTWAAEEDPEVPDTRKRAGAHGGGAAQKIRTYAAAFTDLAIASR